MLRIKVIGRSGLFVIVALRVGWDLFGIVVAVAAVPLDVARDGDALAREVLLGRLVVPGGGQAGHPDVLALLEVLVRAVRRDQVVAAWLGLGLGLALGYRVS